jgi:hypothetical protein
MGEFSNNFPIAETWRDIRAAVLNVTKGKVSFYVRAAAGPRPVAVQHPTASRPDESQVVTRVFDRQQMPHLVCSSR